jgi:methyl-accepting chemotaxis protein
LTIRLTAAVIAALLIIGSPFLLAFHTLRRTQQLEALTAATSGLSLVVVDGLRSAMLAGEPHLLDDVVRRIANQEQVDRVMLLDHRSELRLSSGETGEGQILARETDPTCAVCHQPGVDSPASRTVVARSRGRRVLRSMTTIPNEPECHGCHDSASPINGVLVMDFALVETDHRFFGDIGRTLILGAVMVVVTIAVLVWLLRRMVHRPLQSVVSASQRIVGGDLDAQAIVPGAGEFAELASQVNRMTAHLSHSLRTVETQRGELQTILDAIDDEVLVIDSEQRVVTANQAFRRDFGQSDIESMGWSCCEATNAGAIGADESGRECPVQRVFETGRLQKGIMSQIQSDGQERVIEIHASPLRRADGVVDRVVEVRRDISERRQMEAVVANSERLSTTRSAPSPQPWRDCGAGCRTSRESRRTPSTRWSGYCRRLAWRFSDAVRSLTGCSKSLDLRAAHGVSPTSTTSSRTSSPFYHTTSRNTGSRRGSSWGDCRRCGWTKPAWDKW